MAAAARKKTAPVRRRTREAVEEPAEVAARPDSSTVVVCLRGAKRYTILGKMYERGVPTVVSRKLAEKLLDITAEYTSDPMFELVGSKEGREARTTSRPISSRQRAERERRRKMANRYAGEDDEGSGESEGEADDGEGIDLAS